MCLLIFFLEIEMDVRCGSWNINLNSPQSLVHGLAASVVTLDVTLVFVLSVTLEHHGGNVDWGQGINLF